MQPRRLRSLRGARATSLRNLEVAYESARDRIEKKVVLRAPRERVWRAISDSKEFGTWFGVEFSGPFVAGRT